MKSNIIKDREVILQYLIDNFNYSLENATNWINSPNPNFGLTSAEDLIQAGRADKVMAFLIAIKEGY